MAQRNPRGGALRTNRESSATGRSDTILRHTSGKRGSKRRCAKHDAHRPHTDALRILLTSREQSEGQERNQDNEDNPMHQSSPATGSYPQRDKESPGHAGAFKELDKEENLGIKVP